MYNFYQSQIRKTIQTELYARPSFTFDRFGKQYFGLIKKKSVGPIQLQRFQVMGLERPEVDEEEIKKTLESMVQKYKKNQFDMFFQLGITQKITQFDNTTKHDNEFLQEIKTKRINIRDELKQVYSLKTSFKENMPQTSICYDLFLDAEQLKKNMNSHARRYLNKSLKQDFTFKTLEKNYYSDFYHQRKNLASQKNFGIISYEDYLKLLDYLIGQKQGQVFTLRKDWKLVAGSIFAFDKPRTTYLYGFSDRNFWNLWAHHLLNYKIFLRAKEQWFANIDMMGGAPTGFPEHSLAGVSRFKESLGGKKIEYYGNFDLVFNPWLYKLYKIYEGKIW